MRLNDVDSVGRLSSLWIMHSFPSGSDEDSTDDLPSASGGVNPLVTRVVRLDHVYPCHKVTWKPIQQMTYARRTLQNRILVHGILFSKIRQIY